MKQLRFLFTFFLLFSFLFGMGTVQAAYLDYFDADGGGISDGESLATDNTMTVGAKQNANFVLDVVGGALGIDSDANGGIATTYTFTGGGTGTPGVVYALDASGDLTPADAAVSDSMPAFALGLGDGKVLLEGFYTGGSWTTGDLIYVDATGGLTQTPPSGSTEQVQAVGIATDSDQMYFSPSLVLFEIGTDSTPQLGGHLDMNGYTIFDSTAGTIKLGSAAGDKAPGATDAPLQQFLIDADDVNGFTFNVDTWTTGVLQSDASGNISPSTDLADGTNAVTQVAGTGDAVDGTEKRVATVEYVEDAVGGFLDDGADTQTLRWSVADSKWVANSAFTNDGTDVEASGAMTVGAGLTVTAGGATIGGNSSVTGDFDVDGAATATSYTSDAAIVSGTTMTAGTGLTVTSGGATITDGGLTVSLGDTTLTPLAADNVDSIDELVTIGTDGILKSVTALPDGTTATTQAQDDNSTNIATTEYVDAAVGETLVEGTTDNTVLVWNADPAGDGSQPGQWQENTNFTADLTTGNTDIAGTLTSGGATIGGDSSVTGTFDVDGAATATSYASDAGITAGTTLDVTTDATVGGTLEVTGATTLNDIAMGVGNGTGLVQVGEGGLLSSSTVLPTGTTVADPTADGEVANKLYVDSQLTGLIEDGTQGQMLYWNDVDGDPLTTEDAKWTASSVVINNTDGISVTGDSDVTGAFDVDGAATATSYASDAGITAGTTLDVTTDATVGGTLDVTGATALTSTLDVLGTTTLGSVGVDGFFRILEADDGGTTERTMLQVDAGNGRMTLGSSQTSGEFNVDASTADGGGTTFQVDGATGDTTIAGDVTVDGFVSVEAGLTDPTMIADSALPILVSEAGETALSDTFSAESIIGALNELKASSGAYTTRTTSDTLTGGTITLTDGPIIAVVAGQTDVTLPTCDATSDGKVFTIKDETGDASTTNINITGTIDGEIGGYTITEDYNSVDVYCVDGSDWFIK